MTYLEQFETDVIHTSAGDLEITFLGHGSLMFKFNDKIIHIDPFGRVADYSRLPEADLVLITHEHQDHLDRKALAKIRTGRTQIVLTEACASQVQGGMVMRHGDVRTFLGVTVEVVPAYNIVQERARGQPFHPKGVGNGYILTFGDKRVYVAGDTENIPEMRNLQEIEVAFLPMNLPFTMTPEMCTEAAKAIRPRILYPYHYGDSDTSHLVNLLKTEDDIEVRIRRMA